jgi:hypothetical protein
LTSDWETYSSSVAPATSGRIGEAAHWVIGGTTNPDCRYGSGPPPQTSKAPSLKLLGVLFVGVPIVLFIAAVAYEIAILISLVLFGSSGG